MSYSHFIIYESIGKGDQATLTEDFFIGSEQVPTAPYVPRKRYFLPENSLDLEHFEPADITGLADYATPQPVLRPKWYLPTATQDITTAVEDFFGIPHADHQGSLRFPRKPYYLPDETRHDVSTTVQDFLGIPRADHDGALRFPRKPFYLSTNTDADVEIAHEHIPSADAQGSYWFPRAPYYLSLNTEHDVVTGTEDFFGIPTADFQGAYFWPRNPYYLPAQTEHDVTVASEDFEHVPETERPFFWARKLLKLSASDVADHVDVVVEDGDVIGSEGLWFKRRRTSPIPESLHDLITSVEDFFGIPRADADGVYWFPRTRYHQSLNTDADVTTTAEDFLVWLNPDAVTRYPLRRPFPEPQQPDFSTGDEDLLVWLLPDGVPVYALRRPRPEPQHPDLTTETEDFLVWIHPDAVERWPLRYAALPHLMSHVAPEVEIDTLVWLDGGAVPRWPLVYIPSGDAYASPILSGSANEYGVPFYYDAAKWPVGITFYFEAYFRATVGTVHAMLWNATDSIPVAGTTITTTSNSFIRLRSGPVSLTNLKEYRARFGTDADGAGEFLGGKVIA